ncbi:MAG TPA: bifunctional hydroxymethylpyrimidine kinase/phosphomethylpyrimidine kinase [Steroidobacteraceae bacterium]|nr:bifunctional hydroxymethylpyrimidine kinase/phosphomethylpyrimidine kinase [Steroidobacteraceae bacterium]
MSGARPAVLVVAGSDSSGGAGLVRDVATLRDFGVEALCAVTAVTAQTDTRVAAVHPVPAAIIRQQIACAWATARVRAVKIGMLGTGAAVEAVAAALREAPQEVPVVLDPVLAASSGGTLLDEAGREALLRRLLPHVALLTPNVPEAAILLEDPEGADEEALIGQARRLLALGCGAVLLKGGHARGAQAIDWLVTRSGPPERIATARIAATCRGTGCALASAIAAQLACGSALFPACKQAQAYVVQGLAGRAAAAAEGRAPAR